MHFKSSVCHQVHDWKLNGTSLFERHVLEAMKHVFFNPASEGHVFFVFKRRVVYVVFNSNDITWRKRCSNIGCCHAKRPRRPCRIGCGGGDGRNGGGGGGGWVVVVVVAVVVVVVMMVMIVVLVSGVNLS